MLKRFPWFLISLYLAVCLFSCATTSTADRRKQAEASRRLGEAYLAQGNITGALRELLKAEPVLSQDYHLQHALGHAYSAKGKPDLALKHFKKAVVLKPDFAQGWNSLGTVYLKMERWDDAIESCNRALDELLYATPHFALNNLAEAYRGKKDYARSVDAYKEALQREPRFALAHRGLGLTYMAMGDYNAAISSLEKAVKDAPRFAGAYLDLGRAYVGVYRREKARSAFKKVIEIVPDSPLADAAMDEIRLLGR